MDNMVFDEVNYANGFNFCEWYIFRPLCEVIGYYKDELMMSN